MEPGDEIPDSSDGPVTRVSVDPQSRDTDGPYFAEPTVEVWNLGPERELSALVRGARSGTHLDRNITFARDESLVVSFDGEDRYLVAVGVAGETEYATVIGLDSFFCNDSTTFVSVRPDGVVESFGITTELECQTETAEE